jgi:hypothetical protein
MTSSLTRPPPGIRLDRVLDDLVARGMSLREAEIFVLEEGAAGRAAMYSYKTWERVALWKLKIAYIADCVIRCGDRDNPDLDSFTNPFVGNEIWQRYDEQYGTKPAPEPSKARTQKPKPKPKSKLPQPRTAKMKALIECALARLVDGRATNAAEALKQEGVEPSASDFRQAHTHVQTRWPKRRRGQSE